MGRATELLIEAADTIDCYGIDERSMTKVVKLFNTLTGHDLPEVDGWLFMVCVKMARSREGRETLIHFRESAAYLALAAESLKGKHYAD